MLPSMLDAPTKRLDAGREELAEQWRMSGRAPALDEESRVPLRSPTRARRALSVPGAGLARRLWAIPVQRVLQRVAAHRLHAPARRGVGNFVHLVHEPAGCFCGVVEGGDREHGLKSRVDTYELRTDGYRSGLTLGRVRAGAGRGPASTCCFDPLPATEQ